MTLLRLFPCGLQVSNFFARAVPSRRALALIDGRDRRCKRITLGADKAYDVTQFVHDLRDRSVTPHIAIDGHLSKTGTPRKTAVDGRTTRHVGYGISQRCRKRIEEVFDWIKGSAGLSTRPRSGGCRLHPGARSLQPDPPAQALGSRRVKGKWRIVKMLDYSSDFPDMVRERTSGENFLLVCLLTPLVLRS